MNNSLLNNPLFNLFFCAGGAGSDDHAPAALCPRPGPHPPLPLLPGSDDHPPPPHLGGRRPVGPEAGGID